MFSLNVRGVTVLFPYKPYECQTIYMEKVIAALQEGKNALLESPTGTGKVSALVAQWLGGFGPGWGEPRAALSRPGAAAGRRRRSVRGAQPPVQGVCTRAHFIPRTS